MPTLQDTERERLSRALRPFTTPSAFYLTGEDNLRAVSLNGSTATRLSIVARVLDSDGVIHAFLLEHAMNTDRTAATTNHSLGAGWLLDCVAFVAAGAPVYGHTFVRLQIVRGITGAFQELATLAQGYCNAVQRLAYPGSEVRSSLDQPGAVRSITGTDPAAGVEVSETVPTGARWQLLGLVVNFATSADVATRQVTVVADDGANVYARLEAAAGQVASLSRFYSIGPGLGNTAPVTNSFQLPFPIDAHLLAGHRIRTTTNNLQVADNYGAPQLLVREWLEGA